MPRTSRTINKKQLTIDNIRKFLWSSVRCQVSGVTSPRLRPGFSYVEILLSMFLILALVAILLTTSTVYIHSRRTNLQTIATKMASCEIERLRKLAFSQLPISGPVDASCTSELSKLPAPTAQRTVADFGDPANPKIKQITVAVSWTEKGLFQEIKLETLISENGL